MFKDKPVLQGSFNLELQLICKFSDKKVNINDARSHNIGANIFQEDSIHLTLDQYKIEISIKSNEDFSTFSKFDYRSLYTDRYISNTVCKSSRFIILEVGGYIFRALEESLDSEYFKNLINKNCIEAEHARSNIPISIKEANPDSVYQVIHWCLRGKIPMLWSINEIFELYRTAKRFLLLDDLCKVIITFISNTICEHNFGQVYEFAFEIENIDLEKLVLIKWKENRVKYETTSQLHELFERNDDLDLRFNLIMKMHGDAPRIWFL